jgi:hypothetical protein
MAADYVECRDLGDENDYRWSGFTCGPWVSIPISEAFGGLDIQPVEAELGVWVVASVDERTITYEFDPTEIARQRQRERIRRLLRP